MNRWTEIANTCIHILSLVYTHLFICTTLTYTHAHTSHEGYIPSNYVKRVRHEFEVVALYTFPPKIEDDLPLTKGEKITVLDTSEGDRGFARSQLGYAN